LTVITECNDAIAMLGRVRDSRTDTELAVCSARAWSLTRLAMSLPATTLADVRAQAELLLAHHAHQGNGPEHPAIELTPLRNLLALLPA
jgi:hypothetical protein